MDIRIIQFLALVAFVQSRDVIVGQNTDGSKIFDEKKEASPALWRQVQNVTVTASDSEVISRVVITDLRPEKDGDAKIVEGGEGQKNVTVELKSPTVLRGYDFHIEVYAIPDNNAGSIKSEDIPIPSLIGKDNADSLKNVDGTTKTPDHTNVPSIPASLSTSIDVKDETRKVRNANDKEQSTTQAFDNKSKLTSLADETISTTVKNYDIKNNHNIGKEITIEPQTSTHLPVTSGKDLKTNHETQSRHIRDTHKEEKADEPKDGSKNIPIPRFIPLIVGKQDSTTKTPETNDKPKNNQDKTKNLNGPSTPATTTKAGEDAKQSTTENPRNARDTAKEEKKDNTTPATLDNNGPKLNKMGNWAPLSPALGGQTKDSKKLRNARDTTKEEKKDNTTPSVSTTHNLPHITPALISKSKDLYGPSTPLTTPKIEQDVKQSTTEKPRNARDSTKEEKKDKTKPAALDINGPKLNTNGDFAPLAPALVGQTKDLNGPSTPLTTPKIEQDVKQSTTENPRHARDTIKEDKKDHTTPKTPDNGSTKLNTNEDLTPVVVGETKDVLNDKNSASTQKINAHDSKDGLAQNSDAAKTLGPYTVPISFKLHSSTEVPNGSSTTEKSATVKQNKRDAESKHAEESKDDADELLAPNLPKLVPHDSTKRNGNVVEKKPVISIQ